MTLGLCLIDAKVGRRRKGRKVNVVWDMQPWSRTKDTQGGSRVCAPGDGLAVVNLTERAGPPQHSRVRSIGETKHQGDRPATEVWAQSPAGTGG